MSEETEEIEEIEEAVAEEEDASAAAFAVLSERITALENRFDEYERTRTIGIGDGEPERLPEPERQSPEEEPGPPEERPDERPRERHWFFRSLFKG